LKPINPGNKADPWEANALRRFEIGERELFNFLETNDNQRFRYMAPLMSKQACLTCHEHQGYKLGDVRGGISVSFNSEPFLFAQNQQIQTSRQHPLLRDA